MTETYSFMIHSCQVNLTDNCVTDGLQKDTMSQVQCPEMLVIGFGITVTTWAILKYLAIKVLKTCILNQLVVSFVAQNDLLSFQKVCRIRKFLFFSLLSKRDVT